MLVVVNLAGVVVQERDFMEKSVLVDMIYNYLLAAQDCINNPLLTVFHLRRILSWMQPVVRHPTAGDMAWEDFERDVCRVADYKPEVRPRKAPRRESFGERKKGSLADGFSPLRISRSSSNFRISLDLPFSRKRTPCCADAPKHCISYSIH